KAKIIISGCASLKNLKVTKNIQIISNPQKEKSLKKLNSSYSHQIKDKFSHTDRFLLKVQSGCSAFCTYCTVPIKRPYLWSLPIEIAIDTVNKAVNDGYQEIIITGVNLNQYTPGFSNLVETLLTKTDISLISFGSIPINSIDNKFISLFSRFPSRLSPLLHIPIQTGSNKILKLMHRNYSKKIILEKFSLLKNISPPLPARLWRVKGGVGGGLSFGTDIIVGFPGETKSDFEKTYNLCKKIGFTKIHVFKYSPRPGTLARELYLKSEKISKEILKQRSEQLRKLCSPVSQFV
ncbi:MAG: radical SAM protein, partial [Candidatus Shapirobacteria bacterium]|nr:radical SAM protein [Candidatus Shapirobacteria bacterium]